MRELLTQRLGASGSGAPVPATAALQDSRRLPPVTKIATGPVRSAAGPMSARRRAQEGRASFLRDSTQVHESFTRVRSRKNERTAYLAARTQPFQVRAGPPATPGRGRPPADRAGGRPLSWVRRWTTSSWTPSSWMSPTSQRTLSRIPCPGTCGLPPAWNSSWGSSSRRHYRRFRSSEPALQ